MKKYLTILAVLLCSAAIFANPKLNFSPIEKGISVENFTAKKKYVCKDNVRFINQCDSQLQVTVWGKKKADGEREFICRLAVMPHDTELKTLSTKIKKYKYVEVECNHAEIEYDVITCEHNDMYFYITNAVKINQTGMSATNDR